MKWVGLGFRTGLSNEVILNPTDEPQPTILGKAQSCADTEPAYLVAHSKGKEPLVHPTRNTLETSTDESSSEDENREVDWVDVGMKMKESDVEAPIQGGSMTITAPVMEEADINSRSVASGTPHDIQRPLSALSSKEEYGQTSTLAQTDLAVAINYEEVPERPQEILPMVIFDGVMDEGCSSPLSCTPLNMVGPPVSSHEMELLGDGINPLSQPSRWVAWHMNMFCKQIGVSIKGHEVECLALLRKIEED